MTVTELPCEGGECPVAGRIQRLDLLSADGGRLAYVTSAILPPGVCAGMSAVIGCLLTTYTCAVCSNVQLWAACLMFVQVEGVNIPSGLSLFLSTGRNIRGA